MPTTDSIPSSQFAMENSGDWPRLIDLVVEYEIKTSNQEADFSEHIAPGVTTLGNGCDSIDNAVTQLH